MSDDIPYATPYPWDNPTMEDSQKYANEKLRKRRFVGSGLAALRKNAFGPESTMGDVAKNMLVNLLQQHNIEIGGEGDDFETEADELYGDSISGLNREPLVPDTAENELLGLARSGRLSLFSSLLKVVEDAESSVTTKNLLRHCSMTLRPGDVPGSLDAKEFVLSALHFLSSKFDASSDQLLPLPLIQPIQEVGDLEKRSYEKTGEWKLDEIKDNLLRLEQIFISSPSSWRWLKRETFSPRLPQNDEISFFLKGSIPASATAKKTKGETSRKRKAAPSSPPAGGSPSPLRDSSAFESTSVVEATIVAEGSPTNSIA